MSNILEFNGRTFIVGSYAVSKGLKHIGFSLTNIGEAIDSQYLELIHAVIYYAAEYPFFKEGKPTDFTEAHVYELVDQAGGYNGDFIQKLMAVMLDSINPDGKKEAEEVKTDPIVAKKKSSASIKTS